MSRIFYSVGGEGRGHATRALAVIEDLRRDHEITVYASAQAHELIRSRYQDGEVSVSEIPGLCYSYSDDQRLHYGRTIRSGIRYIARMEGLIRKLRQDIEDRAPALAVVDYEPALPRAAGRSGLPFISLDHQHFLITYDLSSLPGRLRRHAAYMGEVVRAYGRGQKETVVSSFYFPPLKKGTRDASQIGVILRPEIVRATPDTGGHLVAYFRRFASRGMLEALGACGREVRVYGLGGLPPSGRLKFFPVDPARFVDDLAAARALITTAGNQLVGEALYLRKPVLAFPEKGNYEQAINGHFLELTGGGRAIDPDRFSGEALSSFLRELDRFRYCGDIGRLYGNPAARAAVQRHLPGKKLSCPRSPLGAPFKGWASA